MDPTIEAGLTLEARSGEAMRLDRGRESTRYSAVLDKRTEVD